MNREEMRTIAVDFDDTIVTSTSSADRSEYGKVKAGAKEVINELYKTHRIVIWTCRNNPSIFIDVKAQLQKIRNLLDVNGILYDEVDDGKTGKIVADFYIDDRAIEFKGNWQEIGRRLGVE